jgi:hypothetical protein
MQNAGMKSEERKAKSEERKVIQEVVYFIKLKYEEVSVYGLRPFI